jgi:WD40 repeat protein
MRLIKEVLKSSSFVPQAPLDINVIDVTPDGNHIAYAGPDGYCHVQEVKGDAQEKSLKLKGHVGDVLDVKWFPSGEVSESISICGREVTHTRVTHFRSYSLRHRMRPSDCSLPRLG